MMASCYVFVLLSFQLLFGVNSVSAKGSFSKVSQSPDKEELKVVCYFINWASNRYQPQDIDPYLCTHINYAFAILDSKTLTIKPGDPYTDVTNKLYEQVISLRNKNRKLRILLALGGWADSEHSEKYSRMISDDKHRANFINHTIDFIENYGFDGLDLDWEFPVCWWQNCSKGPASDKENFAKLIKEMRLAFDQHTRPLLLTAAISALKPVIDDSYDIEQLNRWLHFINVMTYDYHSDTSGNRTVHHAAMYNPEGSLKNYLNANFTMNYLLQKGASRDKLVMGIPTYGRSYNLEDSEEHVLGSPTANKSVGYEPYNKICQKIKGKGWRVTRDPQAGPYAYSASKWIGYDDPISAAGKARYVKENGFGGVMTWELTMDDYQNVCCKVKYPLIKSMIYGLSGGTSPDDMGCN